MPQLSSSSKSPDGSSLGPPPSIRLGPLAKQLLSGARWYGADEFPAWQVWADDVEEVLAFLEREGRLAAFLSVIRKAATPQHRNACLSEARAAFHLVRSGFRIVQWEPPGEGTTEGDVLVSLPGVPDIFVEVKQPGWQGEHLPRRLRGRQELSPEARQRCYARMKREKHVGGEGGFVAPHIAAMDVVRRNALPKLTDQRPNLVVVVDDLRVTPVGLPNLAQLVQREFLNPDHDPDDPDDIFTYERLGGVLFLHAEPEDGKMMYYRVDFVQNPAAVSRCALPLSAIAIFSQLRHQTYSRRLQHVAGR